MPRRSKIPRRLNAMLLVAALALVQIGTGFTAGLANAANIPAATTAGGCCSGGFEPVCATAQDPVGAFNICARYCIQGQDIAKSDSGLLTSATFTFASPSPVGWVAFPPQSPRLSAAPRAISSTPLIYHLQRLLN